MSLVSPPHPKLALPLSLKPVNVETLLNEMAKLSPVLFVLTPTTEMLLVNEANVAWAMALPPLEHPMFALVALQLAHSKQLPVPFPREDT